MPVSGNELASLDFANLIGGPLDAIVRAQAKSAIATTNFIKEVGFDRNGKIINADFGYTRREEDGSTRQYTLTVPFLAMLPVPYLTVSDALVEFNAKITSTTQNSEETAEASEGSFETKVKFWFFSVSVSGKTSSAKNTSRNDKEERTFDMKILVRAKNQDMPGGTERLLTILEQSLRETKGAEVIPVKVLNLPDSTKLTEVLIETENMDDLQKAFTKAGNLALTTNIPDTASTTTPKANMVLKIASLVLNAQDGKRRALATLAQPLTGPTDPIIGSTVEAKI